MVKFKNINLSFPVNTSFEGMPHLEQVCSYPLNSPGRNTGSVRKKWVIEYHSKFAGNIHINSSGGPRFERDKGTIHLYPPELFYGEDTTKAHFPLQENYVIFTIDKNLAFENLVKNKFNFAVFNDHEEIVGRIFRDMADTCETYGEKGYWRLYSLLMECIHLLITSHRINEYKFEIREEYHPENRFSHQVDNYLMRNLHRKISISEIASHMTTSESSLNHKFKKETGKSPIERLHELRINLAKSMLLKGKTLKNIAMETGFYDEYYLSKVFKKITGVSPGKFKNT